MFTVCYVFTEASAIPETDCDSVLIDVGTFTVAVYHGDSVPVVSSRRAPLSFFYRVAQARGDAKGMTREEAVTRVNGWLSEQKPVFVKHQSHLSPDVIRGIPTLMDVQAKRDRKAKYASGV